jgi:DNA helicase II / ATP-dependent DNA helicase PcrA
LRTVLLAGVALSEWLEDLNPSQREAVTAGDGPLLVVAGAGTGKTKTLACRVAWLINKGVPPDRILLLTFTRRAAAEMLARAGHLTGQGVAGKVWGGTFHSVANRLLRIYGRALRLPNDFTVMDQGDAADLMNFIRNELGLAKNNRRFPRKDTLLAIYSRTVNAEEKLADVLKVHFPWCEEDIEGIRPIFQQYVQRKREQNVFDYDDLLLFWNALCSTPGVGDAIGDRFEHVLVDEYQDTNSVQGRVLQGMRKHNQNIMVVGDDAQSIYSFRAATVRNILDFPKQFPGARVVTLEQNYRSTEPILAASNAVMEYAKERYTKNLWSQRASGRKPALVTCMDEAEQSVEVCKRILEHRERGIPLKRQAVLFRAGYHSDTLEVELARRNIPFHKYGGLKFIEAAHVKDMLAFLRILENPSDQISWFRVLQLLDGVGPKSAQRIMDDLGVRTDSGGGSAGGGAPLRRLIEKCPQVPAGTKKQMEKLRATVRACLGIAKGGELREVIPAGATADSTGGEAASGGEADSETPNVRVGEPPLVSQIECIRHFYEPVFKSRYENPGVRLRDLEQLEQIAARYKSRSRFITDLTLDPPTATSDLAQAPYLDEDYLILSTIHSAKGCEWDAVYIIHAADGFIPSDMSLGDEEGLEEERRLFYVAMTRAKDDLYVFFPLRYYRHRTGTSDLHQYAQLTRFVPPAIRGLFEHEGIRGGTPVEADGQVMPGQVQTAKVDDWLRKLWE